MDISRRAFAKRAAATTALVGVAGCIGDGDDDEFELSGDDVLPPAVAGDPDADVTVMAFEDFSCPHCAQYALGVYPRIEAAYVDPGHVRYEHRDFPIPVDETWSWAVAGAARSVQERGGDEAFWPFVSEIYEHLGDYSYETIAAVADGVGVDGEAVAADAEEGAYRDDLEAERGRGADAGVEGTPTVVVDGEVTENYEWETIESAIEDALE
ncbi:DsbA family protein [Salinilacihabitans rarus]|uniref:DsbA family protein n=1 Tax=Salinilacihabitans rarus TaxID=2961596 RepID=UPI0020C8E6EC|nr:thioredoxin domain-containing protein [Salinilacihabitans rarus]